MSSSEECSGTELNVMLNRYSMCRLLFDKHLSPSFWKTAYLCLLSHSVLEYIGREKLRQIATYPQQMYWVYLQSFAYSLQCVYKAVISFHTWSPAVMIRFPAASVNVLKKIVLETWNWHLECANGKWQWKYSRTQKL